MNKNLEIALQEQLNRERTNHATYRQMAETLDNMYWPGSSAWMRKASDEEQEHADKFAAYMIDRNIQPQYSALSAPVTPNTEHLPAYYQTALNLERDNTESIKALYYLAEQAEDPQTCTFLIWAIDEQTAAERELVDIITMLNRLDTTGWLIFDKGL